MSAKYIEELEKQNEELMERLGDAEILLKKLTRKKGIYPVFKIYKVKVKRGLWSAADVFFTNCDNVASIKKCIKYSQEHQPLTREISYDIIGYKYWRQSINYNWALSGMCRFLTPDLKVCYNIEIDTKTGSIVYT
jgi:hypothetical protein